MNDPLPSKDGVGPSSVWLGDGPWSTLLEFLLHRFPEVERSVWVARMARGEVVDENGICFSPESVYRRGVRLYYYREAREEVPIPFEETILYRDDHLLVADKPHFLPVTPAGRFLRETLLIRLKRKLRLEFLVPIHRIDRETAGVVMFSIQPSSRDRYHALFQNRQVMKVYEAVAPSRPRAMFPMIYRSRLEEGEPFFRMKEVDGESNAETHIELVQARGNNALYRLMPVTGKKHQLRVHMASLEMPILNDMFYPNLLPDNQDDFSRPLQLLAKSIAFTDPVSGAPRRFESERTLG
jgi:tRNA pseudouridine32 synthase/23S rRNA pseudouridine746 synthase